MRTLFVCHVRSSLKRAHLRLLAVLSAVVLIGTLLPGVAFAVTPLDDECASNDPATVEISFGTPTENAQTFALIREIRSRLGLNPDSPKDLRTGSTAPPSYVLDTTGLPNLCLNWSVYGYPNGEGQDANGRTYGFGRPYPEQYLVATSQVFVPTGSVVDLAQALQALSPPGCDHQTDLYIGETLGDDEQAAPHDDKGPDSNGFPRAELLIAYGTNYNNPAQPCGSAPATTSVNCVEHPPGSDEFANRLNVVIVGGTETGTYELLVDGVVVASQDVVVTSGTAPRDIQLNATVAPGSNTVQVLLSGEPIVVDGAPGQRIPDGDGTVQIVAPDCPPLTGAIGDLVFSDLDGDGLQDDGEPGVEDVQVRLTDCSGVVLQTTTTDEFGEYLFSGLAAGCYRVVFVAPDGSFLTTQNAGDDAKDSDANRTTGVSDDIDLGPGEIDLTIDAGLVTAAVDIVTTTFIPQAPGGEDVCVAPDGGSSKPTQLTFAYVGDTTLVDSDQDSGKATAEGSVGPLPATVQAVDGDSEVSGDAVIDAIGDRVTLVGTKSDDNFSSATEVTVGGQAIEFHTSCSQPLRLGDQFGSLQLVAFENEDGGTGEVGPPPPPFGIDGATGTFGQPVTWYHLVTNPGPLPLDDVVVTDDAGTPMDPSDDLIATFVDGDDDDDGLLDPGETWVFRTDGTVDALRYDNIGSVVANGVGADGGVLVPGVMAADPTWYFGNYTGEDLCDSFEKPRALELVYTGNSVLDSAQDPDKAYFSNTTSYTVPPTAFIIVSKSEDPSDNDEQYFADVVALGESFVALASNAGRDDFGSATFFFVYDAAGGSLLQSGEFHTSCSQPLALGDQFGDLQLTGFTDKDGLSPEGAPAGDGGVSPAGSDLCETYDKPAELVFVYSDTSALISAQESDKAYYVGDTAAADVFVIVSKNDDPDDVDDRYLATTVSAGDEVTVLASAIGRDDFSSKTFFFVYDAEGGVLLQSGEFHTSCSQPLALGDQFGNLVLTGFTDKDGRSPHDDPSTHPAGSDLCETYDKPAELTFVYSDTSALVTAQDSDKAYYVGDTAADEVFVIVSKDDDPDDVDDRYVATTVSAGDEVTVLASAIGRDDFSSKTFFFVYDVQGGALLQSGEFHTSCSQPLALGDQFGNLVLTGFTDKDDRGPSH